MLSTPLKREAEENGDHEADIAVKRKRGTHKNYLMKWKLWVIANYEYEENALTRAVDISKHAEDEKDRVNTGEVEVPRRNLGLAVSYLFGEKVRRVSRGPRTDRSPCYLNLKRRQVSSVESGPAAASSNPPITGCRNFDFPLGAHWAKIKDHSSHISFIRHEGWEFNNQRGTIELSVLESDNQLTLQVKCHGRVVDLKTDLHFEGVLDKFSAMEQVWIAIQFIEKSSLCMGFTIPSDQEVISLIPHVSGVFKILTRREEAEVKRAFSLDCLVFPVVGHTCSKCRLLQTTDQARKIRRDKRGKTVNRFCNDRFLTKEEMHRKHKQILQERKVAVADDDDDDAESMDSSNE